MERMGGIKLALIYLVRIKYEEPEAVVYKNMKTTEYPQFLEVYPDEAIKKGLKVSKINVEKKFEEVVV